VELLKYVSYIVGDMRLARLSLYIIFFQCALLSFIIGQEVPEITIYKTSDYQAAQQNWSITHDCEGYTYVANTDGVLIYNGLSWTKVIMPNGHKPRTVAVGSECKVYVGGFEFFGWVDRSDPAQPIYQEIADSVLSTIQQEIWQIVSADDEVYFQSFANLYRLTADQNITQIPIPTNILLGNISEGTIYIPRVRQGLYVVDTEVQLVPFTNQLPEGSKIVTVFETQDGLLIFTEINGIYLVEENGLRAIAGPSVSRLTDDHINKCLRTSNGEYIIGTILGGVYIVDKNWQIKYHLNKSSGLSNNTVLALSEDASGNVWVGTDRGINVIHAEGNLLYFYDRSGKIGTVFTSVEKDGFIYLGSNQGVFVKQPGKLDLWL